MIYLFVIATPISKSYRLRMRKETKAAGAAQCAKRHVTTLLSYALYKWRMVNTDRVKAQFIEYCCSLKKRIYLLLQLYWKERKIQCRRRRTIGSRVKNGH